MRIVITGASGFLGGAVFRQLTAEGFDCLGVSRADFPGLHRVASYADTPAGECLIHCAETNDRSLANAGGEALEEAARYTLSALLTKGFRHVVYASSAVLYGDRWTTPRKVNDPVTVTDTYTRIKRMSEISVLEHGGSVVRLANLYGPGMAATNVLSHILNQLGQYRTITMHALDPVRDFLWIDDAVSALSILSEQQIAGVFNVGSGQGISIGELVGLAQRAAGTHQSVSGLRTLDQPSHLVLDITATRQHLGWSPQTFLEVGVRKLMKINMKSGIQTL
jgi:nucleoside-diphosphate-sugar epimerase